MSIENNSPQPLVSSASKSDSTEGWKIIATRLEERAAFNRNLIEKLDGKIDDYTKEATAVITGLIERAAKLEIRPSQCPGECQVHLDELRREDKRTNDAAAKLASDTAGMVERSRVETMNNVELVRKALAVEVEQERKDRAVALEAHRVEQFAAMDKRIENMGGESATRPPFSWAQFVAGVTLRTLLIWSAVVAVAIAIAIGLRDCLPVLLDWLSGRLAGH